MDVHDTAVMQGMHKGSNTASNALHLLQWIHARIVFSYMDVRINEVVFAEISLRSPRKLFTFII